MSEDSEDTKIGEQAGRSRVSPHLKRALAFGINCLRGVGQVFFMNNPLSGLVILAGLFVQSPRVTTYGMSNVTKAVGFRKQRALGSLPAITDADERADGQV